MNGTNRKVCTKHFDLVSTKLSNRPGHPRSPEIEGKYQLASGKRPRVRRRIKENDRPPCMLCQKYVD